MSAEKGKGGRDIQAPVATTKADGTVVSEHPAFAQFSISRVSGSANLYGSDFGHLGYIRLRIHPSKFHQRGSETRASAALLPILEVDMSEAQWSTALTSMNVGEGTQCTLRRLGAERMPDLPEPPVRSQAFRDEVMSRMNSAMSILGEIKTDLQASGLSKTRTLDLLRKADAVERQITDNLAFVATMFDEHIEEATQKAAVEVNGFMHGAIRAAGLEAMAAGTSKQLEVLGMSRSRALAEEDHGSAGGQAPSDAPQG